MRRICAAVVAALALGACTTQHELTHAVPPSDGTAFTRALSEEYRDFAESQRRDAYDSASANHFARKARHAAAGQEVLPEHPRHWGPDRRVRKEIRHARKDLVGALERGGRVQAPAAAASAQAAFDCWLESASEVWSNDPQWIAQKVVVCRDRFGAAMTEMERRLALSQVSKSASGTAVVPRSGSHRFTIHFAFESDRLDRDAKAALLKVVAAAKAGNAMRIVIKGHADRSGHASYNEVLAQRRAEAVKAFLLEHGLHLKIKARGYGERRPVVRTEDGVREPKNRRVDIDLN